MGTVTTEMGEPAETQQEMCFSFLSFFFNMHIHGALQACVQVNTAAQ